jgi:hypothetical protein
MSLTQACNCVADQSAGRVHYCRVNCRLVALRRCAPRSRQRSKLLRTYRFRVAARRSSTAAGSSSSATTRTNDPQHHLVGLAEQGGGHMVRQVLRLADD